MVGAVHKEGAIEAHLLANGRLAPTAFNADLALDTGPLFPFIEATQPEVWSEYVSLHGDQAPSTLLKRIIPELERQSSLGVLGNGGVDYDQTLKLAHNQPATTLAADVQPLYDTNYLSVSRQTALLFDGVPGITDHVVRTRE